MIIILINFCWLVLFSSESNVLRSTNRYPSDIITLNNDTALVTVPKSKKISPPNSKATLKNYGNELQRSTPPEVSGKIRTHKVLAGQSLYGIGRQYNMSVEQIQLLNQMKTASIVPGQMLKIRSKPVDNMAQNGLYIVKKGETIYQIASKFGIAANELKEMNALTNYVLYEGMVLKVRK